MKNIAMSVRVSAEDAQFIAELDIPGATTPSEKMRALIAEARERRQGLEDYSQSVGAIQQMLAPARSRVRDAEHNTGTRSDLVATIFDWLPEALAAAVVPAAQGEQPELPQVEAALAEQVFRLIDSTLRMGVTSQCRCYSPDAVSSRLGPAVAIVKLIESAHNLEREDSR
jgi:hypothetical protein